MKGDQSKKEWNSFRDKGPNFGKNANYSEYGTFIEDNNNGRFDLNQLDYFCKEGYNDEMLIDEVGWSTWMRNIKGIDRRRLQSEPKWDNKRELIIVCGEPGAGKTRWVKETFPGVYKQPCNSDRKWFDGYAGQETILIDEFEGDMKLTELLQLFDIYLEMVPVKGSFVWLTCKRIVIISNNNPHTWYAWTSSEYQDRQNKEAALRRRVIENGYIMAWTGKYPNGHLGKVDPYKFWPIDEKYTDRSLWLSYAPLIESVDDLIRLPLNEMLSKISLILYLSLIILMRSIIKLYKINLFMSFQCF